MAADQVITVHGEGELAARTGHMFAAVREEFFCAALDVSTWTRQDTRDAVAKQMRPSLMAGVAVRKLYTAAALLDDGQRQHLIEVAGYGPKVRISAADLPHETIVIDRKVMILAGATTRGEREFTVTNSPTLIEGVYSLLQATWDAATDLHTYLKADIPHINADGKEILRLLASGLTDEAAARRLGISLRTYRRRVAELMRLLDAESRFQAGVQAGGLGLAQ